MDVAQGAKDEFEVARIRVGTTLDKELNSILYPPDWKGTVGHQVPGPGGSILHYWTNEDRSAVMEVTCRDHVVQAVRLKLGFWGPLCEEPTLPSQARSDISLECLGTRHRVHLGPKDYEGDIFHGRQRILDVYGPPTSETAERLHYAWHHGPTPRELTLTLQGDDCIQEIYLTLVSPEQAQGMRPLGPPTPYERVLPLPPPLSEKLRQGQAHLREGAHQEAHGCFTEVLDALNQADLDPNFLKAEVSSLQALASGQASSAQVEHVQGLLDYLRTYASYNPPDVLRMWFRLGQLRRLAGDPRARQELQALWDQLQVSDYFHEPEVQALTRQLAGELEQVGVPIYAEEIRRLYS